MKKEWIIISRDQLLEQALHKAFIDKKIDGNQLSPRFIVNQPESNNFLLTVLQHEFETCTSFILSVAFVTQDGLNTIKSQLADLHKKGISGKILTSTYLGFNNPEVFESLLKIPNAEVRISKKLGFHSKGYLFKQNDHESFIIGSSNLTMSALKLNYEWNVKLTSFENGEMISTIQEHLAAEWQAAVLLTKRWIEQFKTSYQELEHDKFIQLINNDDSEIVDYVHVKPNKMQKAALASLADLRSSGAHRGLVISATGTGKTYLAAFDVRQVNPAKMLFIVHREQILNKAMEAFKKVLGGSDEDYGILSGSSKQTQARYLFATIQTISKETYQHELGANAFDYILIDEVHKAGANSYVKTIDFFKPKFLLGMTATPERTDGFNIFELFDYNIAYEIRLQEALKENFLCPFHYFGVTDYEKAGQVIDETADLQYLTNRERVDFLIEKIDYYGCSHSVPKGLVFCSRKEEAAKMAALFNERQIPSSYLSGDHSIEQRESVVEQLESGAIQYIFTVDIFNEGIDIPKVNQVVMLRNTQSSIIFIQQLGRGLRKDKSKDFVTVIDFIGNYKNNYMIPMALSGDNTRNKNNLRRDTFDTSYIEGLSSINFEEVAKKRIFDSIDVAKMDSMQELRKSFIELKNRLNRIPYLLDFQTLGSIDPRVIALKEGTYYNFLVKMKEKQPELSSNENLFLKFVTKELLAGMRPHELYVIEQFINQPTARLSLLEIQRLFESKKIPSGLKLVKSVCKVLDLSFYESNGKEYQVGKAFEFDGEFFEATDILKKMIENQYFVFLVTDLVDTSLVRSEDYDITQPLNLYKKYNRRDVLRLLDMRFNQNAQGIGGYTFSDNHFAIFVTLDKGNDFKASQIAYEDEFISEKRFRWFTKANRTLQSPESKVLMNANDWDIHLFVKRKYKDTDNDTDFYYIGTVVPDVSTVQQVQKPNDKGKLQKIVELEFDLTQAVEPNVYQFLNSSIESE